MVIQVIIEPDEGLFVAHALDFDIVASGNTPGQALDNLHDVVAGYIIACFEDGLPLDAAKRPAPREFFDTFDRVLTDPDSHITVVKLSIAAVS